MAASLKQQSMDQVALLLKAGYKLIFFVTQEELRAEKELGRLSLGGDGSTQRQYFAWTETDGFSECDW
jgi:hypothetical protein